MTLIATWAPHFSSIARQRGRDYFDGGRVRQQSPQADELARATVTGNEDYSVIFRHTDDGANASCTCAQFRDGQYCKHIWATLLTLEKEGVMAGDGAPAQSIEQADLKPQPPKARKRDAGQRPQRAAEPAWMSRLTLLSPPRIFAAPQPASAALPLVDSRQLAYVVSPDLSTQHGGLVVEVRYRLGRRAGWGGLKPFRISDEVMNELTDPVDREICGLLLGATWVDQWDSGDWATDHRRRSAFRLPTGTWRAMIRRMIETRRCLIDQGTLPPRVLQWDACPDPWMLWMVGRHVDEGLEIFVELRRGEDRMSVGHPRLIVGGPDGLVFAGNVAAQFDDREAFRWVSHFREDERRAAMPEPLVVPHGDVPRFLERMQLMPDLPEIDLPADVALMQHHVEPNPHLDIFSPTQPANGAPASKQLVAKMWFEYAAHRVDAGQAGRFVAAPTDASISVEASVDASAGHEAAAADGAGHVAPAAAQTGLIRRDLRRERQYLERLAMLGFRANPVISEYPLLLPVKQLPHVAGVLIAEGWRVRADRHVIRAATAPRLSIRSGIDWFEVHGGVKFQTENGEQTVPLPQILEAARAGQSLIELGDGSHAMLPEDWLRQHGLLTALGVAEGDHLVFKSSQAALLDVLLDEQSLVDVDEQFASARQRLRRFDRIEPGNPTPSFKGELRPYQREGLGWLNFLKWFGMGGVLADDMGLGKTVQVLAMFQAIAEEKEAGGRRQETGDRGQKPATNGSNPKSEIRNLKSAPSLVVAPRSVVFNWLDEAARFTPDLKVVAYSGAERAGLLDALKKTDVVITSYGLLRRDIARLRDVDFNYVVLDEAQAIKNPGAQVAKAARLLNCRHRLALTGTPVENHLGDLWSIFEFLNPGMLGAGTRFTELLRGPRGGGRNGSADDEANEIGTIDADGASESNASTGTAASRSHAQDSPGTQGVSSPGAPAEGQGDADDDDWDVELPSSLDDARNLDLAQAASKALKPFILRRTKQQVLTELPDKTEQTIVCEMESAQRKVYDDLLAFYRGNLLSKLDGAPGTQAGMAASGGHATGGEGSVFSGAAKSGMSMMVLEALLRLRQAACHPGLIDEKRIDQPSAKMEALLDNLSELIDEGHKALVFSQFTSMLAIVRKRLDETGIVYEYLDGKTQDRKAPVERFQKDPKCPVFLISLKAGGLGLNLTAADYVFILDPWWNPAVEQQAIDRAHRIGQTRHVFAYRLICKDTVEQRIAELQQKKKKLADAIVGGQENLLRSLTRQDLEMLLS